MTEKIAQIQTNEEIAPHLAMSRQAGAYAFHMCEQNGQYLPWDQHIKAAKEAETALWDEFQERVGDITVANTEKFSDIAPVYLTVALEKFYGCPVAYRTQERDHEPCPACNWRPLVKKVTSTFVGLSENREEKIKELLSKTEKLTWGLRKTFLNKKADRISFYFEWTMNEKTARVDELNKIIEGVRIEKKVKELQAEMKADNRKTLSERGEKPLIYKPGEIN